MMIRKWDRPDALFSAFYKGSVAISIGLNDAAEHAEFFSLLLSRDESDRAARFRFDKDRHTFVACRGMLRCCLAELLQISPRDVCFAYSEEGKPRLDTRRSETPIEFNLSHTDGLVAIAFARDKRIGIDVERLREVVDLLLIAQHHFSPDETRRLKTLPSDQQTLPFFRCWTRKEAYLKAVGLGLGDMLAKVDVGFLDDEPAFIHDSSAQKPPSQFVLQPLDHLPDGFIGALAIEEADGSAQYVHYPRIENFLASSSNS